MGGGDDMDMAAAARAVLEAKKRAWEEEARKKKEEEEKTKTVKLTQEQIDVFMEMSPPRPIRRFRIDPEEVLELWDPEDPEWFEISLGLMELAESSVPLLQAWQDKKASVREQFLATGEAFVEVTDDEAEAD